MVRAPSLRENTHHPRLALTAVPMHDGRPTPLSGDLVCRGSALWSEPHQYHRLRRSCPRQRRATNPPRWGWLPGCSVYPISSLTPPPSLTAVLMHDGRPIPPSGALVCRGPALWSEPHQHHRLRRPCPRQRRATNPPRWEWPPGYSVHPISGPPSPRKALVYLSLPWPPGCSVYPINH